MAQQLLLPGLGGGPILPHAATHELIRDTAVEMAEALYEECAKRSNEWWAERPDRKKWVQETWPLLIEEARSTLAKMLSGPLPDNLKEQIFDAISLDNTVRSGRGIQIAL